MERQAVFLAAFAHTRSEYPDLIVLSELRSDISIAHVCFFGPCDIKENWQCIRYSQCIPGTASTTPATTAELSGSMSTTVKATTIEYSGTTPTATSKGSASTTLTGGGSAGSGPGTTLQSGCYWIRAVESPNFHKYLQTSPGYMTGIAIMGDYTTAGQFNIVNGQLVELITGGLLYAIVSPQTDNTVTNLAVTFLKSPNTYGTFAFSEDAVTWTIPSIDRPNSAAWLVCTGQQFINLGPYAYNTPAGCADETVRGSSHLTRHITNVVIDSLL